MKRIGLSFVAACAAITSFCQLPVQNHYHIKLSAGSLSFGTGDFRGFSALAEVSANLIAHPSPGLAGLYAGGELIFENGSKNPVIQNPTQEEFFSKTFYHVSSTIIWAKISYYPFQKLISGFNIQAGPSIGYSYRSSETRASRVTDAAGSVRLSTLSFDNSINYGYRVAVSYDFLVAKKIMAVLRVDYSNNNKGEINLLAGAGIGLRL